MREISPVGEGVQFKRKNVDNFCNLVFDELGLVELSVVSLNSCDVINIDPDEAYGTLHSDVTTRDRVSRTPHTALSHFRTDFQAPHTALSPPPDGK